MLETARSPIGVVFSVEQRWHVLVLWLLNALDAVFLQFPCTDIPS
jgi:hypothetical protein